MTQPNVQIAGLAELRSALADLGKDLGEKVVWSSLRAGAVIVQKRAKALAPVIDASHPMVKAGWRKPGTVRDAIKVRRSKFIKGQRGTYQMIVYVKRLTKAMQKTKGAAGKKNTNDPYYWKWLEFKGDKSGAFMVPAFELTKDGQMTAIKARMRKAIDYQARKIAAEVARGSGRA